MRHPRPLEHEPLPPPLHILLLLPVAFLVVLVATAFIVAVVVVLEDLRSDVTDLQGGEVGREILQKELQEWILFGYTLLFFHDINLHTFHKYTSTANLNRHPELAIVVEGESQPLLLFGRDRGPLGGLVRPRPRPLGLVPPGVVQPDQFRFALCSFLLLSMQGGNAGGRGERR